MHAQNRYADVDGVDIQLGDEFCNGAAAALVNFAQLAELPYNIRLVQNRADLAGEAGIAVVGAALAAGTGVFDNAYAVVQEGRVLLLIRIRKGWVIGCADVCGQALGVSL